MGMTSMSDESLANFGGTLENQPKLMIAEVIQKAVISVDEFGTSAAAATCKLLMLNS